MDSPTDAPTEPPRRDDDAALPDVVLRFRDAVAALVCRFGDEILDHIRDAKGIDVEDVRAAMVDPVRPDVNTD